MSRQVISEHFRSIKASNKLTRPHIKDEILVIIFITDNIGYLNWEVFSSLVGPIDTDGSKVTSEIFGFYGINWFIGSIAALDASSLLSIWILIQLDQVSILKNGFGFISNCAQVTTNDKGCLHEWPKSHVSSFLSIWETTITDFKHIWVIPSSRTSNIGSFLVEVKVVLNRNPEVFDIVSCSPAVSSFCSPRDSVFPTPVANWIENISARW